MGQNPFPGMPFETFGDDDDVNIKMSQTFAIFDVLENYFSLFDLRRKWCLYGLCAVCGETKEI